MMDELRKDILAGAALAFQQDGGHLALSDTARELQHLLHGWRGRDHLEAAQPDAVVFGDGFRHAAGGWRPGFAARASEYDDRAGHFALMIADGRDAAADGPLVAARATPAERRPAIRPGFLRPARATAEFDLFAGGAIHQLEDLIHRLAQRIARPPARPGFGRGIEQRDGFVLIQRNDALGDLARSVEASKRFLLAKLQVLAMFVQRDFDAGMQLGFLKRLGDVAQRLGGLCARQVALSACAVR